MEPNSAETNQLITKSPSAWSRLKPKTKLSIAFALLFLVALPLTIFASQLNSDTRSRASYSPTPKGFTPNPATQITCNTTINPPKNCPSGYYCDYSSTNSTTKPLLGRSGICRLNKPTATPTSTPSNIITWKSDKLSISMSDFFVVVDNTIYRPTPTTTFEIGPTSTDRNGLNPTNSMDIYWTENNTKVKATIKINTTGKTPRFSEFYFYPTNDTSKFVLFTPNPYTTNTNTTSLSLGSTNITSNSPNIPKGYISFTGLQITSSMPMVIKPTMSIPEKPPYVMYATKSASPIKSVPKPSYPTR